MISPIDTTSVAFTAANCSPRQIRKGKLLPRPRSLGQVAAYYYLDYRTTRDAAEIVDDVDAALDGGVGDEWRAIGVLCDAREFEELPVRHNEDVLNEQLSRELLGRVEDEALVSELEGRGFDDPHVKAQLLVHARLRDGRLPVADYGTDTRSVFEQTSRVLAALIDVAADAGALRLTLALCHLSQALNTNCARHRDEFCQLPGVGDADAARLRKALRLGRTKGLADVAKGLGGGGGQQAQVLRKALDETDAPKALVHKALRFVDALPRAAQGVQNGLTRSKGSPYLSRVLQVPILSEGSSRAQCTSLEPLGDHLSSRSRKMDASSDTVDREELELK